jgi:hypothetical protein
MYMILILLIEDSTFMQIEDKRSTSRFIGLLNLVAIGNLKCNNVNSKILGKFTAKYRGVLKTRLKIVERVPPLFFMQTIWCFDNSYINITRIESRHEFGMTSLKEHGSPSIIALLRLSAKTIHRYIFLPHSHVKCFSQEASIMPSHKINSLQII